ncbi:hypothetical protein NH340_JMT02776 [Sarcoptes scabiei]|nr:hypothetical protein NH340_JMT02776 [Sarcoptes scabiei]
MILMNISILLIIVEMVIPISAWDNGLLRTPPMGWLSWLRFTCEINCEQYPNSCINEKLYKDMIDRIAEDGYLQVGYKTVNIDDCWMEKKRDPKTKQLVADRKRFPYGIKHLVEYGRERNVSVGIYEDIGTKTCAGFPGIDNHEQIDAKTFSEWGVDSIKMDGCFALINEYNQTYPNFRKALEKQEHRIAYSCSWPAYIANNSVPDDVYEVIKENCNYWRNYDDIVDSWESVKKIILFYGSKNKQFKKFHGPGGWFDPDMLLIGNNGLSLEQSKTQMNFWSIWSAPLMMSADLRRITPEFKKILQNKELISINQDRDGRMASLIYKTDKIQIWTKKLAASAEGEPSSYVVLYFYLYSLGIDLNIRFNVSKLIPREEIQDEYLVFDLHDADTVMKIISSEENLELRVPSSGGSRIVKLVPVLKNENLFETNEDTLDNFCDY